MNLGILSASTTHAALILVASVQLAHAQSPSAPHLSSSPGPWSSENVVYVAGLADVKPNTSGSLTLTQTAVSFANKDAGGTIPVDHITAVSIGDERVATGGSAGKVARLLPYGVGIAVGAVTNKKVDLLTIEYLDPDGGYRGAVFEVPKTQALVAEQQLTPLIVERPVAEPHPCSNLATKKAILVEPIASPDIELPAEYRVLLYEQLVEQLRITHGAGTVFRKGDTATPCAARKLTLTVTAFKKGNEAVRASTGPVGLFVGSTSVGFDVSVIDDSGAVIFEKSQKVRKHGDGDSLNVTRNLAKSVCKHLAKAEKSNTPTAL